MQAEAPGASLPDLTKGHRQLIAGQPVFGFHRISNDVIPRAGFSRIVSKADQFGHMGNFLNQREIVQV